MSDRNEEGVPREQEEPTREQVFDAMVTNRCYVVADLVVDLEDEYDPSRWTIRNRLEALAEEGRIARREHENGHVTYRRP